MTEFKEKYGPWAMVTGASSGIGEEFARQIAEKDVNVILVARRKERLEKVAKEISEHYQIKTLPVIADLSSDNFLDHLLESVKDLDIGLLVNNAGYAVTGNFLENNIESELRSINLSCKTPLLLTHTFGKKMLQRKKGGIIFMSSVTAYYSNPGTANYSAVKAFNMNFSGGLWHELRSKGIDVFTIIPGLVKTEFFHNTTVSLEYGLARHLYLPMKAEDVVSAAINGIGKKSQALPGWHNKMLAFVLGKLIPRPFSTLLSEKILRFWEWETRKYRRKI